MEKEKLNELDAYKIAYDFASELYKKFNNLIKSVILFGSLAKGKLKEDSDIDILVIADDTMVNWPEFKPLFQKELINIANSKKEYEKLHINVLTLSVFWEALLKRDPVVINILRAGIPVFDLGLFSPLKKLLLEGKLPPSKEAVLYALGRIPYHIGSSKAYRLKSLEFLYWAMTDAAQALIVTMYKITPPSPEEIADYLEKLAKEKKLSKIYAKWYREMYDLIKRIAHGKQSDIDGLTLDLWKKRAEIFSKRLSEITKKNIDNLA